MLYVSPVQLEHLYLAYQLLGQAGAPAPAGAYLLGHFKPVGLESHLLDELEEHFIEHHGQDEETAKQSAGAVHVIDAVTQIPLSVDVLRAVLGLGLMLDGDDGCVLLDNGEALPVTMARAMGVRAGLNSLTQMCVAGGGTSLLDYFKQRPEF
jgi:hypothetical protein